MLLQCEINAFNESKSLKDITEIERLNLIKQSKINKLYNFLKVS